MGIGIHTGEVAVGNIGSTKRSKYGVVGRTVNLTARIESFTVGGQVLISPTLINAAGRGLILGEEVKVHAKGMRQALNCQELLGHEDYPELLLKEEVAGFTTLSRGTPQIFTHVWKRNCQRTTTRIRTRRIAEANRNPAKTPHLPGGLIVKLRIAAGMAIVLIIISGLNGSPARAQESLPELIKKVLPAVVTVAGFNAQGKVIRIGSGFFVDAHGHLITNLHVIKGVARAEVKLPKGEVYPLTEMVAADDKADVVKLAVNLPGGSPHYLTVSNDRPAVGEHVVVLGSPLGLEHTVTDGMVSAIRTIKNRGEFLQISAPISPGSSGGPVVNMKGQVIGITTFQVKGQNINFAVPGYRVVALKDGPPRPLPGQGANGKTLPARPGVNIPRPQMQVN